MTDKEATSAILKQFIKPFAYIVIGLIVGAILFNQCDHIPDSGKMISEKDTITPKISQNKQDIKRLKDSVPYYKEQVRLAKLGKSYYKQMYKSVYDSLYSASDSVCKSRLQLANEIKLKQDSAHEAENQANIELIANAFNQIDKYAENQKMYETRHTADTSIIGYLVRDSIPKVAKSEFKRGRKVGRKQGAIFGFGASALLFVGSKVKG